ncbi:MAG: MFS transporter, partial [Christensenellales bacterium]
MNNYISPGVSRTYPKLLMPLLYFMMFSYAMSVTLLGPLITVFMERYQISLSNNGLITLFQGLGGVTFALFGMFVADRFKKSSLIGVLFAIYCAALILLYFAAEFIFILLLFFIVGGSTRMLEAMLNAYMGILYPDKMGFHLNIIHVFFGAGAVSGPILSTVFISGDGETNLIFLALGAFCGFILAAFVLVIKQDGMKAIPDIVTSGPIKKVFNRKMILLFIVAFFYVGFAVGT